MSNNVALDIKKLAYDISILYVEDEQNIAKKLEIYLKKIFNDVRVAYNGEEGLYLFKKKAADIVITDIQMPSMNGIEMVTKIKEISTKPEFIFTSAYSDRDFFLDAIELNVSSYILKPIIYEKLLATLYRTVKKIDNARIAQRYQKNLENMVTIRTKAYQQIQEEKLANYEKTLTALVDLVEKRDSYTGGHSQRVAKYSNMIAKALNYSKEECENIYKAAILHDVGKIATPDAILLKPGKLNKLEYKLIQEHVTTSYDMLKQIPMFEEIADIVIAHHEKYDGTGYPKGLKGDEIPKLSKIMIIADAFDAMTTSRIYKSHKNLKETIYELKEKSGTQFDPKILDVAINVLSKITIENVQDQIPKNDLELERFAYFFNDQLTGLHNKNYLELVLKKNIESHFFNKVHFITLDGFMRYNIENGWEIGNNVLKQIASILNEYIYSHSVFRINADDFIILSNEKIIMRDDIISILNNSLPHSVKCNYKAYELDGGRINGFDSLEEAILSFK